MLGFRTYLNKFSHFQNHSLTKSKLLGLLLIGNSFSSLNRLSRLTNFLDELSKISSRNQIIQKTSDFILPYFQEGDRKTIIGCLKVLACQLEPASKGIELNLADNSLIQTLAKIYGVSEETIKEDYKKIGDLAKLSSSYQAPKDNSEDLEITEFIDCLKSMATIKGKGAREQKELMLEHLLKKLRTQNDIFYVKNLRVGMSQKSVIAALEMLKENPKYIELKPHIEEEVFGYSISLGAEGTSDLVPGMPINCMLARPAFSAEEMKKLLKKFSTKVIAEVKYDGERAQVHYDKGTINIYSRGQENQNEKYHYWLEKLLEYFKSNNIESCILDCEVVPYDYEQQKMLPFSDIIGLAKKLSANSAPPKENIVFFAFDILYLNKKNLLEAPLPIRKKLLHENFKQKGIINVVTGLPFDLADQNFEKDLESFFDEAIKEGYEGLIIKSMDSEKTYYDTKGRTQWIKLKRNSEGKNLADTLDLVPIAGYWGKGKRSGTLGAYLLGTGFSEEFLEEQTKFFKDKILEAKPDNYICTKTVKPDVWLEPRDVWEVECDKFSLSQVYTIGKNKVAEDKGLSLRFPRLLRRRQDKKVDQSTTVDEILDMFKRQNEESSKNDLEKVEEDS